MHIHLVNLLQDCSSFNSPNKKFQPVSLLSVAAGLRIRGFDVSFTDANAGNIGTDSSMWRELDAKNVVISTASLARWQCPVPESDNFLAIVRKLAENNKLSRIVITGPHASLDPEKFLIDDRIIIVNGEPEYSVIRLFEVIRDRMGLSLVPGIICKGKNQVITTNKSVKSILPELPAPAWDLVDMDDYSYSFLPGLFALMETSRGCTGRCTFCFRNMHPSQYVTKHPNKVIEEIRALLKMGIESIFFMDLDFCINRERTISICQTILDSGLCFDWSVQARPENLDHELIELMAQSGCCLIQVGIESSNPVYLERIGKSGEYRTIKKLFKACDKSGIDTIAFFMLGLTEEDSPEELLRLARYLSPTYASFKPYVNYRKTLSGEPDPLLSEKVKICRKITRSFYLDPRYIKNILFRKNLGFLFRNFTRNFLPQFMGSF